MLICEENGLRRVSCLLFRAQGSSASKTLVLCLGFEGNLSAAISAAEAGSGGNTDNLSQVYTELNAIATVLCKHLRE